MSHSVACHEVGSSVVGCYSLTAAASNPDMVDMLPRVRGQGVMDLEFERDGGCRTLVCLSPFLATPPVPVFLSFLSVFFFFFCVFLPSVPPSLPPSLSRNSKLCWDTRTTQPCTPAVTGVCATSGVILHVSVLKIPHVYVM